MTTTRTHRAAAAAASLAVAAAGLAAFTPAATAAVSGASFTCTVPLLGDKQFTIDADATFPAKVTAGAVSSVKFDAKVTIPADVAGTAAAFFGPEVAGTADINSSFGGVASTVKANIPKTAIPTSGPLVVDVAGTGTVAPKSPGSTALTISGFSTSLVFYKDGKPAGDPLTVPCKADGVVTVATTTVAPAVKPPKPPTQAKAKSVIVAKAKYAKKKKTVTASATVKASGKAASGKVKFTLKRGKKVVKISTKTLNRKGAAKATFKKVSKKGAYTLTAQYAGTKNVKASKKVVRFRVK